MTEERWFSMPVSEQILNIGGEVNRSVMWKTKADKATDENEKSGYKTKSAGFLLKALDWLNLSKADPKNVHRISELDIVERELIDYFNMNRFGNNEKTIMEYWDSFLSARF